MRFLRELVILTLVALLAIAGVRAANALYNMYTFDPMPTSRVLDC